MVPHRTATAPLPYPVAGFFHGHKVARESNNLMSRLHDRRAGRTVTDPQAGHVGKG